MYLISFLCFSDLDILVLCNRQFQAAGFHGRNGLLFPRFFLICFFALQWNFLLCTLLAIGLFAGLMLLTRPSPMAMERLEEEATAREKLREARKDFVKIQECAQRIRDPQLSQKAQRLARSADGILDYLEKHPDRVEGARRFLEYYQTTAAALLNRYVVLQQEEMKTEEDGHLRQSACRAADALIQAFEKQYRNLLQNELMDMDADIQVIEQMMKMEGLL